MFPIGGGLLTSVYRPDLMRSSSITEWTFYANDDHVAESMAPKFLSGFSTHSTIRFTGGPDDSGMLFCVGGITGGFTVFVDDGVLQVEYNSGGIYRSKAISATRMKAGQHEAVVELIMDGTRPLCPAELTLSLDGEAVASAG